MTTGWKLMVATSLVVLGVAGTAEARARVWHADEPGVSHATIELSAPPDEVYRVLTDYPRWPDVFSSVQRSRHVDGEREEARVELTPRRFDRPYTLQMDNEQERRLSTNVVDGKGGTRVEATMKLHPAGDGTRAFVTVRTTVGSSLRFVFPDFVVRRIHEGVLTTALNDLEKHLREQEPQIAADARD